ncbi:hypothetical protein Afil01_16660 [Actinorhabdospora filicis]|uniref:Protein translocase subunit SecE n=1 Tax=Actinorhabdospora filicis TaxID=1785913 RepID=A0A9W6SGS0_9ACTN|nr:preprotein translocase subunit SecE [Actinorhabdospora filicis]GLZ76859.1 hypothetical protein Afil01_16660 [Actinorhabdospora filicis]
MADKDRRGDDEAEKTEAVKGDSGKKDAGSVKKDEKSLAKADGTAKKSEPTKKSSETEGGQGRGPLRFFREVVEQLRKVIRPSRKEMLTYTLVVLVFVSVMVALIYGIDLGFTKLVQLTFGSKDAVTGQ